MPVHCKVPPSIYLAGADFFTGKYLAEALNKMSPTREISAHTPPPSKKKNYQYRYAFLPVWTSESVWIKRTNSFLTLLLIPNCHFTTQHTKNSIASFTSDNYSDNYKRGFQLRVEKPNPSQSF